MTVSRRTTTGTARTLAIVALAAATAYMVACDDATAPTPTPHTAAVEVGATPSNLYTSGVSLSDVAGPDHCAVGWFSGACWGMGLYSVGNKQGSNAPPTVTLPPVPAAQAIVMLCMSNCLVIEDSLLPRVPNLVRCSAGGLSSYWLQGDTLTHSQGNPWDNCDAALAGRGYGPDDVALVLTKGGNSHPSGLIEFARNWGQFQNTAAKVLESELIGMGRTVKARYRFAVLGFTDIASTHHSATGPKPNFLPPEYSFEFGLGIRWAIAAQDTTTAPMIWVAYTHNPSDPASYYENDGVHPSALGAGVRAQAIAAGLASSPFLPWYTGVMPTATATAVPSIQSCNTATCIVRWLVTKGNGAFIVHTDTLTVP